MASRSGFNRASFRGLRFGEDGSGGAGGSVTAAASGVVAAAAGGIVAAAAGGIVAAAAGGNVAPGAASSASGAADGSAALGEVSASGAAGGSVAPGAASVPGAAGESVAPGSPGKGMLWRAPGGVKRASPAAAPRRDVDGGGESGISMWRFWGEGANLGTGG